MYVVVAAVKHLRMPLKELSCKHNSESVASFEQLMARPISGFCFGQWRTLFLRLRNEYHTEVTQILGSAHQNSESRVADQTR